jgi:hypothetical protein
MSFNRTHVCAAPLPPEAHLLIACGAVCATNEAPDRVASLAAEQIAWHLFLRMAAGHGMSAIAWRALAPHANLIPTDVLAALRANHLTISARALYLANELLNVIQIIGNDGVPAVAFKGPTLASLAYDELGLREFSDLDILIPPGAIARVRQTLIAHGYRPRCSDARAINSPVFQCYEELFVADDGVAVLDLHWRILPHYISFSDADSLWSRVRRIGLRGRPVSTLAEEDLLFFLCVHGAKHGWPLLSWICDLAGLIHRCAAIDWKAVISRAQAVAGLRSLLLGLRLAHDLMNVAIPSDLILASRDNPTVGDLKNRVVRAMFRNCGDRAGLSQELIIPLRSIESSPAKIRYLAGRAFTPTLEDWEAMPLPAHLFPLYYLTRPFRLSFAQMKHALRKTAASA